LNLYRTPFFLPKLFPSLLWRVLGEEKVIYLTFDDGPIPGPTEFVIEQLKKYDAKATFFCIGDNVRKYPLIFKKVLADGHAIGNHTFNHLKGWSTSNQRFFENINQCNAQLTTHNLKLTTLFRPPYGRITNSQIRTLKSQYKIVMWDVLTHDYSKNISSQQCLKGSVNAVRSGSIIVFHDSVKAERNLTYVLPKFLEHFSNHGYKFKSLLDT
jgi:peptidoglycan/xylan/chitin deacetylase (PgdA/CDA1 family)